MSQQAKQECLLRKAGARLVIGFSFAGVGLRKLVAVMVAVSIAAFATGCGEEEIPQLEKNFTCTAIITQDDIQYSAQLERIDGVGWKAVFSQPETIEGMEISLLSDSCTVNFKELTYTADTSQLPENGMVQLIASATDRCISGKGVECSVKGDNFILDGKVRDIDFTAQVSGDTITSLEIAEEITAQLSDYSF